MTTPVVSPRDDRRPAARWQIFVSLASLLAQPSEVEKHAARFTTERDHRRAPVRQYRVGDLVSGEFGNRVAQPFKRAD